MSFMSSTGADCSANANPLAQFSKHTNNDRSLQQSLANQQQNRNQQQQYNANSIRQDTVMNPAEREKFDRFLSTDNSGALNNFQPMKRELNQIDNRSIPNQQRLRQQIRQQQQQQAQQQQQQHNNNSVSSWSNDFKTASPITHTPQLLQSDNKLQGNNWANDFQSSPQLDLGVHQHQLNGPQFQRFGGSNMMMMNRSSPAAMMMNKSEGKIVEVDSSKWEDQFNEIEKNLQQDVDGDVIDDKYKANFDEVWESLNDDFKNDEAFNKEYQASWEKDFHTYATGRVNYGKYQYVKQNQYLNNPNAFEIGVRLMESGARLSEAALAFEAAVQQDDSHVEAWLRLGLVQTQNEKEIAGISALEKCLNLDPDNLKALMSLAISYVNEGYDNAAYATLERWIETKYPQISIKARRENPKISAEDRYSLNKRITELFIKAAQLSPTIANMDADVQTGLGVLFYSMEEFNKTIDCFKAAIQQNPNDSLMWNRLGASLANSNRSEEAVEAYSKALQLNPNFVRARYNLGVSCINMGLYRQAVEHLLGGLSMHNVEGIVDNNDNLGSLSLLETLKRAFLAMDRRDLLEKVKPGMDLNQFKNEFSF